MWVRARAFAFGDVGAVVEAVLMVRVASRERACGASAGAQDTTKEHNAASTAPVPPERGGRVGIPSSKGEGFESTTRNPYIPGGPPPRPAHRTRTRGPALIDGQSQRARCRSR